MVIWNKQAAFHRDLVTHNLCHLFLFPLDSILIQSQSPVHSQSSSKLVPPGTTVLRSHTVADGLRSVEAVMTQIRHDRLWRICSVEKRASWASNNYRADGLNHRLMKTSCTAAGSRQVNLVHSRRNDPFLTLTEPWVNYKDNFRYWTANVAEKGWHNKDGWYHK